MFVSNYYQYIDGITHTAMKMNCASAMCASDAFMLRLASSLHYTLLSLDVGVRARARFVLHTHKVPSRFNDCADRITRRCTSATDLTTPPSPTPIACAPHLSLLSANCVGLSMQRSPRDLLRGTCATIGELFNRAIV